MRYIGRKAQVGGTPSGLTMKGGLFFMKKFLLLTLSCLLCVSLTVPAQANEWGLKGGVLDIVSETDRYDGYSAVADTGDLDWTWTAGATFNFAALENRYHTVLIAASKKMVGDWQANVISTTALYQPDDATADDPRLLEFFADDVGNLKIKYGPDNYTFSSYGLTGEYYLSDVYYGDDANPWYSDSFRSCAEGLEFWSAGPGDTFLPIGDAKWLNDGITLEEFNITQMPRNLADIRRMNRTGELLTLEGPEWTVRSEWKGVEGSGNLAVYSAPDASSWRAADGKAAVSMAGDLNIIGREGDWVLVEYEVSPRTSRIGYIQADLAKDETIEFASLALVAEKDTFLTDDPFVSQYAQMTIPAGTELTGLAKAGEFYAYVETEKEGKAIRGFVPLKDLMSKYDRVMTTGTDLLSADVHWDVMEALVGKWYTGGDYSNKIILFADGGYRPRYNAWDIGEDFVFAPEGNYRVYTAEDSDDSTYVMKFFTEDNQVTTYTLRLNEDASITLTDADGVETVWERDEYSTYGNG